MIRGGDLVLQLMMRVCGFVHVFEHFACIRVCVVERGETRVELYTYTCR